jgi:hypothetical protein
MRRLVTGVNARGRSYVASNEQLDPELGASPHHTGF